MPKKISVPVNWYLIAILIIASFLRFYNLKELPPGLYPDEAMNGNNAQEALDTGNFKPFYPENFGREGLFINIQALFIKNFGHHPWALRLPSAIFGILTVLGLYFLTKELFKDKNLALLAAFLLATSFWHINFSRIGFRAIMTPFFLIWGIYFLLLSFQKINQSLVTNHLSLVAAAVGGLLYGLGFHSYIAYRTTPLLLIFISYFIYKTHSHVLKNVRMIFLVFVTVALLIALPLVIYFRNHPQDFLGRTVGISIFTSETPLKNLSFNILKTAGMFNFVGDFNWRHNVAGRRLLFWPVGLFFIIGIILGYKSIFRRKSDFQRFPFLILFLWLLITGLPVVISNEGLPHALRSILMAPPVFILAAIGGLKIYAFLKSKLNKTLLLFACYLLLSLLTFEAYFTYFITWGQNPNIKNAFAYNDYIIAQYLNSLPKETLKYVILNDYSGTIERDNPISLQSILFLTDTFTDKKRDEKNIIYLTKGQSQKQKINGGIIIKL